MGSTHGRLILFLVVALALIDFILRRNVSKSIYQPSLYTILQEAQPFFKNWFFWVYFFMPFFSYLFSWEPSMQRKISAAPQRMKMAMTVYTVLMLAKKVFELWCL
jgi:hypothetical protein